MGIVALPGFERVDLRKAKRALLAALKNYRRRRMRGEISLDDLDEGLVEEIERKYTQWGTSDRLHFFPSNKTVKALTPGVYEIKKCPQNGLFYEKIPVRTEGLLRFPDTTSDKVVGEIQKFWEREDLFKEYNITYKRGIILYGPPGSGKSCTVQLIMHDVVSRRGIVVQFRDPFLFIEGMRTLRQIEKETPVVVIMEDIDSLLEIYNESEILNILDGVNEVSKVVFLATTNYPQKLGHRIINRPSRFDKRFRIGFPSPKSREIYLRHLIGEEKIKSLNLNIDKWVKDTDEFSIAHLKELFVAVVILGDDYKKTVKNLATMKDEVQDKDYEAQIGFGKDDKSEDYYD
jgi:Cdc6-like AAA superfamily ATPase